MTATVVEFYFDPVSPYAWLAAEQLDRLTETGGRIVSRPILFAALLKANGTKGPAEVPTKRAYVFRDVMRQAKRLGLPFRGPPSHPFNPLAALRVIHAVTDEPQRLKLTHHLLAAIWREGVDVSDPDVLHGTLTDGGFNAADLLASAATEGIKVQLRDATQAAIDAGVFGVPTFRLHGELFWGADRVDTVIWALQGGTIDNAFCESILTRPSSTKR